MTPEDQAILDALPAGGPGGCPSEPEPQPVCFVGAELPRRVEVRSAQGTLLAEVASGWLITLRLGTLAEIHLLPEDAVRLASALVQAVERAPVITRQDSSR